MRVKAWVLFLIEKLYEKKGAVWDMKIIEEGG